LLAVVAHRRAGGSWAGLPPDVAVAGLAAGALAGCLCWLALATSAAVIEALTGAPSALVRSVSPVVVRRAVALCCGLAVGAGGTLTATAEPADLRGPGDPATLPAEHLAERLAGLPLPDRAVGDGPRTTAPLSVTTPAVRPTALAAVPSHPTHVVRRGESLWSIAGRMLGSHLPAEVDVGWRALYRANRAAIGDDPDLVRTGTVLHVPAPLSGGDPATSSTTRKDVS
jgi:nucleoid-associated protein YgaU